MILKILKYCTENGFWNFVGCCILLNAGLYFIVNMTIRIISRILRTINVLSRGWPPDHLDADGDHKPIK